MKKQIAYMLSVFLIFALYSCGGSSGGPHLGSASSQSGYQLKSNILVFYPDQSDLTKSIIPFPNDILLQSTSDRNTVTNQTIPQASIYIPTTGVTDPATLAFYTAINELHLQGLSPNTPIMIPLATDKIQLNQAQLQQNIKAIDITNVLSGNPNFITPLIVKQNGNVINGYPAVPFNPGHQYAVVVENGIDKLQSSTLAQLLIGDKPLTGNLAPLEQLRQAYAGLLPLLLKALQIPKNNILEMFTFKVASKTLGLSDYGQIKDAAKGKINPSAISARDIYKGYPYAYLDNMTYSKDNKTNEYMNKIDPLSDLPLICSKFSKLQIIDNKTFKDINVYQLGAVSPIASDLKAHLDNSTIVAADCYKIFDNATLYDNVSIIAYNTKLSSPSGIIIFQHGLYGDKSDAEKLASDKNGYFDNYEIYAMDLPWHGKRIPPNPMFASQTSVCKKSGSCYLTSNPINDVMNIYQSLLDMHTFTKLVYLAAKKADKNVYFVGQSMGSITGSMLLNLDNITHSAALKRVNNYISKAVLNVGGANYSAILTNATNPEIMRLLCSALKIPTNQCTPENVAKYRDTISYNMTIALFQLVLDPVDPAFMARNPSIKDKVLLQSAYHDTLVPNTSNEILHGDYLDQAQLGQISSYVPIQCINDNVTAPLLSGKMWYMFEGNTQQSWINHGFLIHTADSQTALDYSYPSTVINGNDMINIYFADLAEELAREQICGFLTPPVP